MVYVHLLRVGLNGAILPGGVGPKLSRVPAVGEFIAFREDDAVDDPGPYRVTKVQHYPARDNQCDAEVWVVRDDSVPH